MPTARIDGIDIYFERHGDSGEPLVLVHGYTGDITDWRHQLPEFSRTHRVLIIDNRGHGRSQAPADRARYSVERMSHDVEELVAHAGFERYHLVGHSMGGAIVQEIALRSPGRLLSLTLHDTGQVFRFDHELFKAYTAARHQLAETQGMAAVAKMEGFTPPVPHMPAERLDETRERLTRMSVDAFIGAWHGLESWPGTEGRAHAIAAPTMVIYGELEPPPFIEASRWLATNIPGAVLESVPEAAHSPQFERPEIFNAALRRHLDRSAGGAAK